MDDLSEKEQIEQMRAWWSEYGNYVIGGIVVGVALIVGVSQYRSHTRTQQTEASVLYETMFEAVADGDVDDAESAAIDLYMDYASTAYPSQARLAMARLYMDKGRDQDAANALRAIVDEEPDSEIGLIARLRLAKVLHYQDKAQDVIDLLSGRNESAFAARYSETLGDAYVSLGLHDQARIAYLIAMADNTSAPTVDRTLVQMKVDDLPAEMMDESTVENADGMMDGSAAEMSDDSADDELASDMSDTFDDESGDTE